MVSFRTPSPMFSWRLPRQTKTSGKSDGSRSVATLLSYVLFSYLVSVSYLEIYNEEVRDLLGKDRDKSLEVIGSRLLDNQTSDVSISRSKNDRTLVFTLMVYRLIYVNQQPTWRRSCVPAVLIVRFSRPICNCCRKPMPSRSHGSNANERTEQSIACDFYNHDRVQ